MIVNENWNLQNFLFCRGHRNQEIVNGDGLMQPLPSLMEGGNAVP
jgi:hypothetical protein